MRIEDNRRGNKCITFKDLEAGGVFEHVGLNMIMIKLDPKSFSSSNKKRYAVRIDDVTELWNISPESRVIPINAKLVIEE